MSIKSIKNSKEYRSFIVNMEQETLKNRETANGIKFSVIGRFLFNKKYFKGSLYGYGIFPFWIYIKLYGKPVFKLSRKLGLNVFFSLMMANILGSASHVGFFINANPMTFVWFIISLIVFTNMFYWNHRINSRGS